jgi:hypothetical protein
LVTAHTSGYAAGTGFADGLSHVLSPKLFVSVVCAALRCDAPNAAMNRVQV